MVVGTDQFRLSLLASGTDGADTPQLLLTYQDPILGLEPRSSGYLGSISQGSTIELEENVFEVVAVYSEPRLHWDNHCGVSNQRATLTSGKRTETIIPHCPEKATDAASVITEPTSFADECRTKDASQAHGCNQT